MDPAKELVTETVGNKLIGLSEYVVRNPFSAAMGAAAIVWGTKTLINGAGDITVCFINNGRKIRKSWNGEAITVEGFFKSVQNSFDSASNFFDKLFDIKKPGGASEPEGTVEAEFTIVKNEEDADLSGDALGQVQIVREVEALAIKAEKELEDAYAKEWLANDLHIVMSKARKGELGEEDIAKVREAFKEFRIRLGLDKDGGSGPPDSVA